MNSKLPLSLCVQYAFLRKVIMQKSLVFGSSLFHPDGIKVPPQFPGGAWP